MERQDPETDDACTHDLKGVSYMTNADGHSLYCRVWEPSLGEGQRPRAAVFVSHGLGSHCLLGTEKLVDLLTSHGILVFAHDHINHGRSDGERGVIPDLNILVRDVLQHVDAITSKHNDIPVFLFGASMGGLICTEATLERPEQFAGLMLIAPALKIPTAWKIYPNCRHTLLLEEEEDAAKVLQDTVDWLMRNIH
ncbi:MGLL [Branchiostoma lanceolatum]|uniref:MGLL protein n=1 Tax=Branchiostoma lanceolatum TaxID=7740 RepID=A0A8S4MMK6_BRALA|nr:MGLL [Branchiostoma lanceolatum]